MENIWFGLLQGLTEFLPVSSSGHLVLLHSVVGNGGGDLAFDAILHVATVLAVMVYFRNDIFTLVNTVLRKLSRLPVNSKEMTLAYALMIGTIPAVVLGLLLENIMATLFRNPLLVAGVLVVGSILFIVAEWFYLNKPRSNKMTVWKGLQIGFFQTLALVPGMSRSGASIAGGMLLGLSRQEAARFSFLLAVPVLGGAGAKKILELLTSDSTMAWDGILLGALAAFVSGLLAIHFMLTFVKRHTLWPFIWYRIVLASIVILIVYLA